MTRIKVLAFLAVATLVAALVLALMIPAATFAQQVLPHRFAGSAMVDGTAVADGTQVVATVVGTTPLQTFTATTTGGNYVVTVTQPEGQTFAGRNVTFTVRGFTATQVAVWSAGDNTTLNLSASSQAGTPTPVATPRTPGVTVAPTTPTRPPTTPGVTPGVTGTVAPPRTPTVGPVATTAPVGTPAPGAVGTRGERGPAGGSTIAWIALVVGIVGLLTAAGAFLAGRTHSHVP